RWSARTWTRGPSTRDRRLRRSLRRARCRRACRCRRSRARLPPSRARPRWECRRARRGGRSRARAPRPGTPSVRSSRRRQLVLERLQQVRLERRLADLLHDLAEEAEHDEPSRLVFVDAARLQVEQLLVVEAPGGRRVTGTLDVTGLDLEVR